MAIVISGVNNNDKITASDGTIDLLSGVNFNSELTVPSFKVGSNIQLGNAGIITATTFTGNVTGNINNSTLLLQTGGYERVRITSSGLVGIQNSGPTSPLQVGGGTNPHGVKATVHVAPSSGDALLCLRGGNPTVFFDKTGSSNGKILLDNVPLAIHSGNSDAQGNEILRITSTGRLLIGTTTEGFAEADDLTINSADHGGITIRTPTNKEGNIAFSDTTSGTGEYSGLIRYRHSNDDLGLWTNSLLRLLIDSSGRVLIGTTTEGHAAGDNLTVADSGNCGITIRSGTSSTGSIYFSRATSGSAEYSGAVRYLHADGALQFYTNGAEKLRITSAGHLNIGAASPTASENGQLNVYITTSSGKAQIVHSAGTGGLRLAGTGSGSGSNLIFSNDYTSGTFSDHWTISHNGGNDYLYFRSGGTGGSQRVIIKDSGEINTYRDGNGDVFEYWRGGSQSLFVVDNLSNESNTRMRIRNPNGVINYNSSSDYRLKENDVKITDGITRIKKLRPIQFKWKTGTNIYDGFFAHEVSEACPMAVDGTKDQVATADDVSKGYANNVGDPIYQGIDHGKMVPVLTAALQEAIAKIETLETKVSTLEGS